MYGYISSAFRAFILTTLLLLSGMLPVKNAYCDLPPYKIINVKNIVRLNSKEEEQYKDYFVNFGTENGARVGGELKIYRDVKIHSAVEDIDDKDVSIAIGSLKIIKVEADSCIARLLSMRDRGETALVEYDAVMIGDVAVPVLSEALPDEVITLPGTILFDFDKATIRKSAGMILKNIAEKVKGQNYSRVVIDGHTDSIGSNRYNMGLSRRRAQSVFKHLTKRYDLRKGLFEINGFGEEKPVTGNKTKSGRQKNRRVEISFYK